MMMTTQLSSFPSLEKNKEEKEKRKKKEFCQEGRRRRTFILCGGLINGISDVTLGPSVVVIRGEHIERIITRDEFNKERNKDKDKETRKQEEKVGDYHEEREEEEEVVIDLGENSTLLPGLIDSHTHPLIHMDDYQFNHLKMSSAFKALKGLAAVQSMLSCGWTTIRIAGDADIFYAAIDLKKVRTRTLFSSLPSSLLSSPSSSLLPPPSSFERSSKQGFMKVLGLWQLGTI
jgi:hypothetical protein